MGSSAAFDFNGYIHCISGNCWDGTANFANWKSSCSRDTHAINSIANMGGVVDPSGILQSGSVMIGAGANPDVRRIYLAFRAADRLA